MKPNKLTSGHNVMWESSRMVLPEHVVKIVTWRKTQNENERPTLAADEIEDIERKVTESLAHRVPIILRFYDEHEDLRVIGVVDRIDANGRRINIDGEWFRMVDVIGTD